MATDGPTPKPCDRRIYKDGTPIVLIEGSSNAVEKWVRAVAKKAKAKVDWHYSGGVAQVLYLGNGDHRAHAYAEGHHSSTACSERSGPLPRALNLWYIELGRNLWR